VKVGKKGGEFESANSFFSLFFSFLNSLKLIYKANCPWKWPPFAVRLHAGRFFPFRSSSSFSMIFFHPSPPYATAPILPRFCHYGQSTLARDRGKHDGYEREIISIVFFMCDWTTICLMNQVQSSVAVRCIACAEGGGLGIMKLSSSKDVYLNQKWF